MKRRFDIMTTDDVYELSHKRRCLAIDAPPCNTINIEVPNFCIIYANVGGSQTLVFARKDAHEQTGSCGNIAPEKLLKTPDEMIGAINQIRSIAERGVCACRLVLLDLFGGDEGHAIPVLFYNSEKGLLTCVISDPNSYVVNNRIETITYDEFEVEKGYIATAFVNIFQAAGIVGINVIEYPIY